MKTSMLTKVLLCCALFSVVGLATAGEFYGKCLLQVKGKKYLDGDCPITMEEDGSFKIGVAENAPITYFAMVSLSDKNTADGFWNEDEGANHAQSPLGTLKRKGACWQNKTAKVCAWK